MTKVTLITGGSRGIGAATARLRAAEGHAVAINYRSDATAAEKVRAEVEVWVQKPWSSKPIRAWNAT